MIWSILLLRAPSPTNSAWRRRIDIFTKDDLINEPLNVLMTEVFIGQPLALVGSAKYCICCVNGTFSGDLCFVLESDDNSY